MSLSSTRIRSIPGISKGRKIRFFASVKAPRQIKARNIRIVGLAMAILCITLTATQIGSKAKLAFMHITSPLKIIVDTPFQIIQEKLSFFGSLQDRVTQRQQINSLEQRVMDLQTKNLVLQNENKDLRDILNAAPVTTEITETARVISSPTFKSSYLITILKESNKSQEDDVVISAQGLVGRIIECMNRTASVLPVTHYHSRVPVFCNGNFSYNAIAYGNNDNLLTLEHIDKHQNVHEGDALYTSGHGGIFPKGILVGTVIACHNGKVFVHPAYNSARTSHLTIIKSLIN